jgi:hypothetical protein
MKLTAGGRGDFTNMFAQLFGANKIFGKWRLANGTQIWQISAHK